jgi:hypothetical protein
MAGGALQTKLLKLQQELFGEGSIPPKSLLRTEMIEAFCHVRPKTITEYRNKMPERLRVNTSPNVSLLKQILELISRTKRPKPPKTQPLISKGKPNTAARTTKSKRSKPSMLAKGHLWCEPCGQAVLGKQFDAHLREIHIPSGEYRECSKCNVVVSVRKYQRHLERIHGKPSSTPKPKAQKKRQNKALYNRFCNRCNAPFKTDNARFRRCRNCRGKRGPRVILVGKIG